ncbi:sensor histidine kinase [Nocardiopsis gilva YIM 90087]|uniref:histidine kinase n=1 Tax=Nocardiopsis gilva YIM 90087 TaxID=1235441 RepID=A0A223SCL3_9ACTN|nr:HAMP domain-containing sensor histidine kinase [Nocardiopsis gilva]ASU85911.1 sensor histidine kinase [Nocardiopsis gilva YIM 90087]
MPNPFIARLRSTPMTVRTKLALIYTGVFLVGGVLLLGLNYVIVSSSLADRGDVLLVQATDWATTTNGEEMPTAVLPRDRSQTMRAQPAQAIEGYQDGVLNDLLLRSGLGLVAATALAALGGWLVAGRPLRRLHQVTETARRLSEHDLGRRLALSGPPDEFRELGSTFNGMLERLQSAFESQRRFVANASHELRTPMASQRAAVEVALAQGRVPDDLRPAMERVLESADRSERLISGLLLLARSDRGLTAAEPVDLADAAQRALGTQADAVAEAGVELRSDLTSVVVDGDQVLLEQLVGNLVDNAVRYNRPDGSVWIEVEETDAEAVLRVANPGPEVADADRLFEPFDRGGRDRLHDQDGGSGLGLSIVRSIAMAHGGRASAAPRPGGGLVVTVRLPLLADDETP